MLGHFASHVWRRIGHSSLHKLVLRLRRSLPSSVWPPPFSSFSLLFPRYTCKVNKRGGRRAGPLNHSHVGDGGEGKEISVESGLARRVRRVVEESGKFNARPDLKGCVRCEGESLRLKARGIRLSFTAR